MERGNGACPVHGQEQEAGSSLTDVMHVQVRRHGRGGGQVESKILLSQHRAWRNKNFIISLLKHVISHIHLNILIYQKIRTATNKNCTDQED